jgi:hypothetical protein
MLKPKFEWVRIEQEGYGDTYAMHVPGGTVLRYGTRDGASSMVFLPNICLTLPETEDKTDQ